MVTAKGNNNIFPKTLKNPIFGPFWALFRKNTNFPKNWALSLLNPYDYLNSCPISRKTNEQIVRKVRYARSDGETRIHGK